MQKLFVCPIRILEVDPRCSFILTLHLIDTFFDTQQELEYDQQVARDVWRRPLDIVQKNTEVKARLSEQSVLKIACNRRVEDKGHPLHKYNSKGYNTTQFSN